MYATTTQEDVLGEVLQCLQTNRELADIFGNSIIQSRAYLCLEENIAKCFQDNKH